MASKIIFDNDDLVAIGTHQVPGTVVGVTHYAKSTGMPPNYYVRYTHAQTQLPMHDWFSAYDLAPRKAVVRKMAPTASKTHQRAVGTLLP